MGACESVRAVVSREKPVKHGPWFKGVQVQTLSQGAEDDRFDRPSGVACDPRNGEIIVADTYNHCIRVIRKDGKVELLAGTPCHEGFVDGKGQEARFNTPTGVAVDGKGNVLVADKFNHCIRWIDRTGQVTTFAGNGSPFHRDGAGRDASFNEPTDVGIEITAAGKLFVYVTDSANHVIRRINSRGYVQTLAGTGKTGECKDGLNSTFNRPIALALHSTNIVVADWLNNRLRLIDKKVGSVYTITGSKRGFEDSCPAAEAEFFHPKGVVVDSHGHIIIADTRNHRLRLLEPWSDHVDTLAGSDSPGYEDGDLAQVCQFNQPTGLCMDLDGNVIVADTQNNCIRKVTPLKAENPHDMVEDAFTWLARQRGILLPDKVVHILLAYIWY